jgi:hypothetical protein
MGQISKDAYVNSKIGANRFPVQQTTRQVFDTFISGDFTAVPESITFFKNFAGKGPGATNLNQGRLDSSESMIIKTIGLSVFTDAPSAPISGAQMDSMNLNVYVGNQRVLKDYPLHLHCVRGAGNFAPYRFQGVIGTSGGPSPTSLIYDMRCLTDIVIPGDVNFYATLDQDNAWISGGAGTRIGVRLTFAGYGQLFSAGTSY